MLRFNDGFDSYSRSNIGLKWDVIVDTSSTLLVGSSYGRYGSNGVRIGDNASIAKAITPTQVLIIGFAFKVGFTMDTAERILCALFSGTSLQCELRINTSNQLELTHGGTAYSGGAGVASMVLSPGVGYFVEWKVKIATSISTNDTIVKLNDVPVITLPSSSNCADAGGTTANTIQLGHGARGLFTTNYQVDVDDFRFFDSTGSTNNDFLGDRRIETLFPTADGSDTGAWVVSGAGAAYECVNEVDSDADTTYIYSGSPNDIQTFTFGSLADDPDSVEAVTISAVSRKDDAGSRTLVPLILVSGTEYDGTTAGLADTYVMYSSTFEINPDTTAAWTGTEVNALEAGVKLVS